MLVERILEEDEHARNSDNYLYYIVCKTRLEAKGLSADAVSLEKALLQQDEYGLPPFESVRRSRQKLQAQKPELSASTEVREMRRHRIKDYKNFARS